MIVHFKKFWNEIGKRELFIIPFFLFSFVAYMPSFLLSKVQFEDFHRDFYYGEQGKNWAGRWGMILWTKVMTFLEANDILEKFIGYLFMVMMAVIVACIFYYLSGSCGTSLKYMTAAVGVSTYPLLNEIWGYGGVNYMVAGNMLIVSLCCYYILVSEDSYLKKIICTGTALILVASSYEAGAFFYVTLVLIILFLKNRKQNMSLANIIVEGISYAIPLAIGVILSTLIGKTLCLILQISSQRYGATGISWGKEGAVESLIRDTLDMYLARGLVYLPIGIFVICAIIFLGYYIYTGITLKNINVLLLGSGIIVSLFFQSIVQCMVMPYRTAHTLNIFVGFVFFLIAEWGVKQKKNIMVIVTIVLLIVCYRQSIYFNKMNYLDYKVAENDVALVRQIGYEIVSEYDNKPVLFIGKEFVFSNTYSEYLDEQVVVDNESFLGTVYTWCQAKLYGHSYPKKRYIGTNMFSSLFLLNVEPDAMELYFSYCGYDIDVLNNMNIEEEYPEVYRLVENRKLKQFEYVDMGDFVVVGL